MPLTQYAPNSICTTKSKSISTAQLKLSASHFGFWLTWKPSIVWTSNLIRKRWLMLSWFWCFEKGTMSQPTTFSRPLNCQKNLRMNEDLLLERFDKTAGNCRFTKSKKYLAKGNLIGKLDQNKPEIVDYYNENKCSIQCADISREKVDSGCGTMRCSATSLICVLSMLGSSLNLVCVNWRNWL